MAEKIRLQRYLAQAGVASRRKCEELIVAGRVRLNGRVVSELGTQVDPRHDRVDLDGKRVVAEQPVYLLLNKPKGTVTTLADPDGRATVMSLIKGVRERVFPVGRLDFNTEGVLVLTNDGELANALMHPRSEVEKIYHVKLRGRVEPDTVERLRAGVTLDDGSRTAPAEVQLLKPSEGGNNTWLEIAIHEGKNRQIHRMAEAVGHQVAKLERVRYAGLDTEGLRPGKWRHLTPAEVKGLHDACGLPFRDKVPAGKNGGPGGARRGASSEAGPRKKPGKKWSSGPSPTSTSSSRSSHRSSKPSRPASSRSKAKRRS